MPKFSSLPSGQKQSKQLITSAIFACLLLSTTIEVAWANDWVPNTAGTETLDLTAVPSIDETTDRTRLDTESTPRSEEKQSPYLMLSTPPSSKANSKSAVAPLKVKSKTPEYDLSISDYEAVTNTTSEPKQSLLTRMVNGPKRAIGVTCGVCVGVPVSIARDTRKYTGQMKKSMNDGFGVEKTGDVAGHMWSGACAVPFGIGSGLVHGSVSGVQRAVEHGKTHPFSKKSMSLGVPEKSLSNRLEDLGNN